MRKITGLVFIFLSLFALVQCAKRGSPSGGEKDLEGPELIKAFPSNLSVSFKGQKIKISPVILRIIHRGNIQVQSKHFF